MNFIDNGGSNIYTQATLRPTRENGGGGFQAEHMTATLATYRGFLQRLRSLTFAPCNCTVREDREDRGADTEFVCQTW